jgi:hypothetical protein
VISSDLKRAIEKNWRKTKAWQPGWEYINDKQS